MAKPAAPKGLGAEARKFWRSIIDIYELNPHEVRVLREVCREIDVIETLQAKFDADGEITSTGSMGQEVIHPVLDELRRRRSTLATLLKSIPLPDADQASSNASAKARAAVNARWKRTG